MNAATQHSRGISSTHGQPRADHTDLPALQRARSLWQQGQFDESLKIFEKTVRANPRNTMALIDAARAFGSRFEMAKAESYLSRLSALSGNRLDLQRQIGQTYRMIRRRSEATDMLQGVVNRGADADAHLELAILQERSHQLEAADATLVACLKLRPGYIEAQLVQARVWHRQGEVLKATKLLTTLADGPTDQHWLARSQAWSELGRIADEQADYDRAMSCFEKSKALLQPYAAPLMAKSQRGHELGMEILDRLCRSDFDRWLEQSQGREGEPIALLTGPPRSGTTLLEKALDAHPEIISSDELPIFSSVVLPRMLREMGTASPTIDQLDAITDRTLTRARHDYRRLHEAVSTEPIGQRLLLDKNPALIRQIPLLLRLFPSCRILFAIRDPRDVLVSSYMCALPLNANSVHFLSLEDTVTRYEQDLAFWYRLREMLPCQWAQPRYEDTVEDLPSQARNVLETLGLDWDPKVLDYREHLSRRATESPTYRDVHKPIYTSSVGRWKNYQTHIEPFLERLAPWVEKLGYDA